MSSAAKPTNNSQKHLPGFLALEAAVFLGTPHGHPGRWLTEHRSQHRPGRTLMGWARQLLQKSLRPGLRVRTGLPPRAASCCSSPCVTQTPPVLPKPPAAPTADFHRRPLCARGGRATLLRSSGKDAGSRQSSIEKEDGFPIAHVYARAERRINGRARVNYK